MVSHEDVSQADSLNSIVTISDLLSHDNRDLGEAVETLNKLIEAIARLKGVLIGSQDAVESFGESGGFESLLKAIEKATVVEDIPNQESTSEGAEPDGTTAVNDTD